MSAVKRTGSATAKPATPSTGKAPAASGKAKTPAAGAAAGGSATAAKPGRVEIPPPLAKSQQDPARDPRRMRRILAEVGGLPGLVRGSGG